MPFKCRECADWYATDADPCGGGCANRCCPQSGDACACHDFRAASNPVELIPELPND